MRVDDKYTFLTETVGPASYSSGGFDVEVSEARNLSGAMVTAGGGYSAEVVSITGNTVKVKVYASAGTEVAAGTDLSGVTFKVLSWSIRGPVIRG